jgi:hypothetical protein
VPHVRVVHDVLILRVDLDGQLVAISSLALQPLHLVPCDAILPAAFTVDVRPIDSEPREFALLRLLDDEVSRSKGSNKSGRKFGEWRVFDRYEVYGILLRSLTKRPSGRVYVAAIVLFDLRDHDS